MRQSTGARVRSARERDVLRLMAGGYSNREIADMLATAG
jgi:DNA-binding CsgD family transcriptional regulator